MLLLLLNTLYISILALITYQDFKQREVSVLLFFVVALIGGYLHYSAQYLNQFLLSLLINLSTVLILISILILYVKFIMKIKLKESIGSGDLLFFIVFALSFPSVSFVLLLALSFVFSLVIFFILKQSLKNKTVPLAGLQAFFLGLVISLNTVFNFVNLYAL